MTIAVYTVNFSQYDSAIHSPAVIEPNVDYIYFTDHPFTSDTWQVRVVPMPTSNPKHASRYYFDQSTLVLPDYDYTIMHGANAVLTASPTKLIETYMQRFSPDIALFRHPHRRCIYDEAKAVIELGKDSAANVTPQMSRYRSEGFPVHFGLSACIFVIRRNTPAMSAFEQAWWREVSTGSHRDQLSFDYIRWKLHFPITYIPGDPFAKQLFYLKPHG